MHMILLPQYKAAYNIQICQLCMYVLSQLQRKAEVPCLIREFQNWDEKSFPKLNLVSKKILMELQESKKLPNEIVSKFTLKIEKHFLQLLIEITLNISKAKELSGRIAAMEEEEEGALHHF